MKKTRRREIELKCFAVDPMTLDPILGEPLRVINVGLEVFAAELTAAGVPVVHVDWRPPSGGPGVAALLGRLDDNS